MFCKNNAQSTNQPQITPGEHLLSSTTKLPLPASKTTSPSPWGHFYFGLTRRLQFCEQAHETAWAAYPAAQVTFKLFDFFSQPTSNTGERLGQFGGLLTAAKRQVRRAAAARAQLARDVTNQITGFEAAFD